MTVSHYDEERVARLLRMLPPAPEAWVQAAKLVPSLHVLDDIVARAEADAEFRRALIADLEATLQREGVEPDTSMVEAVRRRLDSR
jgi:hypothetical protein